MAELEESIDMKGSAVRRTKSVKPDVKAQPLAGRAQVANNWEFYSRVSTAWIAVASKCVGLTA